MCIFIPHSVHRSGVRLFGYMRLAQAQAKLKWRTFSNSCRSYHIIESERYIFERKSQAGPPEKRKQLRIFEA